MRAVRSSPSVWKHQRIDSCHSKQGSSRRRQRPTWRCRVPGLVGRKQSQQELTRSLTARNTLQETAAAATLFGSPVLARHWIKTSFGRSGNLTGKSAGILKARVCSVSELLDQRFQCLSLAVCRPLCFMSATDRGRSSAGGRRRWLFINDEVYCKSF